MQRSYVTVGHGESGSGESVDIMRFCVGTTESMTAALGGDPNSVLHAVRAEEAFTGTALCGAPVRPWPEIGFPAPTESRNCPICRFAVDYEDR